MSLSRIALAEMPANSIVLIEEQSGDMKRIFVQMLAAEALAAGKRVTYISPRMKTDIVGEIESYETGNTGCLEIVERLRDHSKLGDHCSGDVCIIENLPLFFIDAVDREILHIMNILLHASRSNSRLILLTSDSGILPSRQEKILHSMADGVIELTIGFNEQQINRYIHVHKLKGKPPADKLIPFSVENEGRNIYVDTRERYA